MFQRDVNRINTFTTCLILVGVVPSFHPKQYNKFLLATIQKYKKRKRVEPHLSSLLPQQRENRTIQFSFFFSNTSNCWNLDDDRSLNEKIEGPKIQF